MAEKLTEQQSMAVRDRGGKMLVSAAAGSGKTKVLVDRLLSYLMDPSEPENLDAFLIITYTKAAASELRGKIAAKLTQRIAEEPENRHLQKQMQRLFLTKISTVHGFCADVLREYAYKLDIPPDFRVADESECRELRNTVLSDLLERVYEEAQEDPDFQAFVDTQGLGRNDRFVPEIIEKVYDSARCHKDPEGWLENCLRESDLQDVRDISDTVWGKYLLEDLRSYLKDQIHVMKQCMKAMECSQGLEKPASNFKNTIVQLEELAEAESWNGVLQKKRIDYGRLVFPKKNVDLDLCERAKAVRTACRKGLDRKLKSFADESEQALQDLKQACSGTKGLLFLVKQFDRAYSAAKKSRRVLDFSDLEQKMLDLLLGKSRSNPTAAATEIGRRYREIMVDEYQDSNGVQDAIFDALTRERKNCFFVGDVKQSIYQFRLADPGIFLEKYRSYAPAETAQPGEGRKILLSHNFRSGPEVISGVNAVFQMCMSPKIGGLLYGEAEALREGVLHERLPDSGVEFYAIDVSEETYPEEAAFVADKIQHMLSTGCLVRKADGLRPVQPEDIVILLRSPGSAAGYFQRALEMRGIHCTSGSGTDLLKTEEIGTFRSFLQTIQNPRQDIPLVGTLASPIFGFSADDLAQIRSIQKKGAFFDALLQSESDKAKEFLHILAELREIARMNPLTTLLENCIHRTRLDSIYAAMPDGQAKQANLQTFYQLACDYEKGNLRDLSQFLDYLDTLEERGLVMSGGASSGCVSIMSIHKSKGLEFPVVFLCNLSRKFNQENLRAQILCDKTLGLGLSVADHENRVRYPSVAKRAIAVKMAAESISEEMRVLYVAMTRARDRLIMTYASQTLENDLKESAMLQDFDKGALFCQDVLCMGDWILLAAMSRTEAGALHLFGAKPAVCVTSDLPWKISVEKADADYNPINLPKQVQNRMPEDAEARIIKALSFQYGYLPATSAPSKQTATNRKGRVKDAEAAENAQGPKEIFRRWRKPSFLDREVHGKEYGNAIHSAMQYICYEKCGSLGQIENEIQRLEKQRYISEDQRKLVNCEKLAKFFASEIGRKLVMGTPCLREFKFSILDDGSHYGEGLEGERVLLQGVVDCALLENDGITVLDFKTDYVTEESLPAAVEKYRPQVQTYADAMERIYEMPVKERYLYFFKLDRFVLV